MPTIHLNQKTTHRSDRGHPWIYATEIARADGRPANGDEVAVLDCQGRPVGRGFFSATSKIAVRLLTRGDEALDATFLRRRITQAIAYREQVLPGRPCRRLVSSEADLLPGLIVDRYQDVLAVQCTTAGMDRRLPEIVGLLQDILSPAVIVERNDISARRFEGLPSRTGILHGDAPGMLRARMGALDFPCDVLDPHKTGAYLDQQMNWGVVAGYTRPGSTVLDACCHLGGFALHVLAAGAASAVAIDSAEDAIAGAKQAAEWAGCGARLDARLGNVFDLLPELERTNAHFDLIILDPPSFTKTKDTVEGALRGYKELHVRALRMLDIGGRLATFTCSHHVDGKVFLDNILAAAHDTRRTLRLEARLSASPDHPVLPAVPESEYLKGYVVTAL